MKTKKNFWKRLVTWFTISRVLITFWNLIAFSYHFFIIGIDSQTSVIIQITALMTEYLVSGPYEQMLIWSNKKINEKIINIAYFSKIFTKTIVFIGIFAVIYYTTYYLRLKFFTLIEFGVDSVQLTKTMINMFWFTITAGPIMGYIVIWRKNKHSPSVWEGFFLLFKK